MTHRPYRRLGWLAATLAFSTFAAACSGDADQAAPDGEETTTSAAPTDTADDAVAFAADDSPCLVSEGTTSGEPIKVGALVSRSGPEDFSSSGQGAKAFFECVNANGGINGRPVEYLIEDDHGAPNTATAAATRLVEEEGVVGMVGSSSLVDCEINTTLYEEQGLLAVYGAAVPRECFYSSVVSPTSSGPRISTIGIGQYMVEEYGAQTLACVAQNSANTGAWACSGLEAWGQSVGVSVRTILHDPNNPDFGAVVLDAVSGSPDGVILMEPADLAASFLAAAKERDLRNTTHWGGPSSQYLAGFPAQIGEYWWGYYDLQAELNVIDADTADNQAWLATIARYGQKTDTRDTYSQAGWLAAKIFTDTLLDLDPDTITREAVTGAIRGITNYPTDLGCGGWYFGPGERHNPNHAGRIVTINASGKLELVKECDEHDDPDLADVLSLEAALGLG